jgi:hypothetical protein
MAIPPIPFAMALAMRLCTDAELSGEKVLWLWLSKNFMAQI